MVYRCQLLYQPFGEVHSFVYQSFTFFLTSVHLEHSSNSIPNITIAQPSWNLPFSPCDPNIFHECLTLAEFGQFGWESVRKRVQPLWSMFHGELGAVHIIALDCRHESWHPFVESLPGSLVKFRA